MWEGIRSAPAWAAAWVLVGSHAQHLLFTWALNHLLRAFFPLPHPRGPAVIQADRLASLYLSTMNFATRRLIFDYVIMFIMKDCTFDRLNNILEAVLFIVLVLWADLGERKKERRSLGRKHNFYMRSHHRTYSVISIQWRRSGASKHSSCISLSKRSPEV